MKKITSYSLLCLLALSVAGASAAPVQSTAPFLSDTELPDFSRAGLEHPLEGSGTVLSVADFGARPNDDTDDTTAIEAALAALPEAGGVVEFKAGTYHLSRPLRIERSGTTIRGAGREATKILFAYDLPKGTVRFFRPLPGETLRSDDLIEIHSHPARLRKHQLYINGQKVFERGPDTSGGERFSLAYPASSIPSNITAGKIMLTARVERMDGTVTEERMDVDYDPSPRQPGNERVTHSVGIFMFLGDQLSTRRSEVGLASAPLRGMDRLELVQDHAYTAGDFLLIEQKADAAWLAVTQSARKDFDPRYMARVQTVEGRTVILDQPLRMDFAAHATVRQVWPIRDCVIEGIGIEQTEKLWTDGILFNTAFNCVVRDVRVDAPGRNPVVLSTAKHCEIRDSAFLKKPWFSGGGGTGYLGFTGTWDSLIENVEALDLRHAPALQAWSSGNVLRKSKFTNSDINFHMLWAHENLIEQCELDAERGTGSYGYAVFAQKPEVAIHGPGGGPRNVIYNNRFKSPRSGVWLGGSNEGWIIAENFFDVATGPGMLFRKRSTDHLIQGNTLIIRDGAPAFETEDASCTGIRYVDNLVAGTETLFSGPSEPAIDQGNAIGPIRLATPPEAAVPSIYEWQRAGMVVKSPSSN